MVMKFDWCYPRLQLLSCYGLELVQISLSNVKVPLIRVSSISTSSSGSVPLTRIEGRAMPLVTTWFEHWREVAHPNPPAGFTS